MEGTSFLEQAKALEAHATSVLAAFDVDSVSLDERKLIQTLKRLLIDARLDARDYEYAETRLEQLRLGATARKTFERLRQTIVAASERNVFSAVDVAHLTAQIEYMIANIRQE